MRAAVIEQLGTAPRLRDFPAPAAAEGITAGRLVAAALNPVDLAVAAGQMPLRTIAPPFVAGYEAVVELPSGSRAYIGGPPPPYGTLAQLIPVPDDLAFPVPSGTDPGLAASLGVPGLTAWLALEYRAQLKPGESVLVLGGGTVGQLALQAAQAMGAGPVVVADRSATALGRAQARGADATIDLSATGPGQLAARFAETAGRGFDVIIDLIWGPIINHAIDQAAMHARLIQVANVSGPTAPLAAAVFRNKLMSILGFSMFLTPIDIRRDAYTRLLATAAQGAIGIDIDTSHLDQIGPTWARLQAGPPDKLIVTP